MNKKTQLIVLTLILIVVLGGAGILYSRLSAGAQTGQLSSTTASDTDSAPGSAASDSQSPSSEPPAQEGDPAPDYEEIARRGSNGLRLSLFLGRHAQNRPGSSGKYDKKTTAGKGQLGSIV